MAKNCKHRVKKIFKRIFISVFVIIIILLVLFLFFSPSLIKNYINGHGKELTGRPLNIEKLKINYFSSVVSIYGGKMFEPDSTNVFIGFDSLSVDLKPLKLLKDEIALQKFRVVNLQAKIIQNDSLFNFDDIIDFYSGSEDTSNEDTSSTLYVFNLDNLEVAQSSLLYTDELLDNTIALQNIDFCIPHISWGGKDDSKADVSFTFEDGGSFSSSFAYNTATGDYSGNASVSKLDAGIILPYARQYVDFTEIGGTLSAQMQYSGNQFNLEKFVLKGNTVVDSLIIKGQQGEKVLGLKNAKAEFKEIEPMQYHVEMGKLEFNQPYAYFALLDSLSNFEKMLVYGEGGSENDTIAGEEAYKITIDSLVVNDGLVDFSDQRFAEEFDYELSGIEVGMDSISLDGDWVDIVASMKLNKRGTLEGALGINPFEPFQHVELEYVLSDFQLPDINIYSKHYAGLPIMFGDMYYVGKTSIIDNQLNSNNQLVIRNVELGRKTGGLYNIPVKLALFILKDKNGDIEMDIPVTGDLSDPKTRIGLIIWNTFKGFVVKIASSPFRALGNLLDTDPEELQEFAFLYGDTCLAGKHSKSLNSLLKLEQLKPGLQIDMQYLNDKKLERFDVASQIMQKAFEQESGKKVAYHQKDYLAFLKKESGKDSLVVQDYEWLLAPEARVDSILEVREKRRVTQVRDYLHSQNDSTTIRVFEYNKDEVLNIGSRPRFVISYNLAEDSVGIMAP